MGQPILRAFFKHSILKNYVRGGNTEFGGFDRAEVETNDVTDFRGIKKGVENLPMLREHLFQTLNNFRDAQQDILETFLDRGELHRLSPRITAAASGAYAHFMLQSGFSLPTPACGRIFHGF